MGLLFTSQTEVGSLRTYFIAVTVWLLFATMTVSAQDSVGLIDRALDQFEWESVDGNGVRAYFKPDSFASRHRHMLLRSAQGAVSEVLGFLEEPAFEHELRIIYVESREEMNELTGRPVTGLAVWSENGLFLVVNPEWRSFEVHEITHVVTMGRWGSPDPTSRWMIEGISIVSDGWCREYPVDEVAHYLLLRDELPPLSEFFNDFQSLGEVRGGMYAGSIIGFIRKTYGIEAMRKLWMHGIRSLCDSHGTTVDDIEALWKTYLIRTVKDTEVDYDVIDKDGCG